MIPINLKVQGFLTFKKPLEIDFRELTEDGIFLISGPTGSGKTSIFDAISFALYGAAPTSGRTSVKELRSHLITSDEELIVEFKFTAGPHEYEIRRWQKGQAEAKQRLVIDGKEKEALTKVMEIRNVIIDALGLTADQFCKIVMLPQGEFRNFLVASSKEKSDILRKLFDTDHYAKIRFLINEKLKNIYAKYNQAQIVINSEKEVSWAASRSLQPAEIIRIITEELGEAGLENSRLKEHQKQLRLQLDNLNLRLDTAGKLNRDLDEQAQLELILSDAQALETAFKADLEKAEQLNRIKPLTQFNKSRMANLANCRRKEASLIQIKIDLDQASSQLLAATLDQAKNPMRRIRLTEISKALDKLQEVLDALKELGVAESAKQRELGIIDQLTRKMTERAELSKQRETLMALNEEYSGKELAATSKGASLREELATLNQHIRDIKNFEELKTSLEEKIAAKAVAETQLQELTQKEIDQKAAFLTLKEQFEKQGLAKFTHLVSDGQACPLCGAMDHPALYTLAETISNDTLKAAESTWRQTERKLLTHQSDLGHLQSEIEQTQGKLSKVKAELVALEVEEDLSQLELKLHTIEAGEKVTAKELKSLKALKEKLAEERQQIEIKLDQLKTIQADYDLHNEELTRLNQTIATLQTKTRDQDEAGLTAQLEKLKEENDTAEELIRTTETKFQSSTNQVTQLNTTLLKTEEDIKELTEEVANQTSYFTIELNKLELSETEFLELEKELAAESALRKKAQDFFKQLEQNQTRLDMMKDRLEGKTKVDVAQLTFEIEALNALMDEVSEKYDEVLRRQSQLDNALAKIRTAAALYEKYDKEYETAKKLDGTTGKGTTFENYVLGYYLDGVLMNANGRLNNMTNGRFRLIRQAIDTDGKRSIEGLDINVYDTYSNSERDVKTLSGGESFKASLAMALGLSDFIQENKSGIRLDTIFIDEGFGTLDQESLDSAMETILEIQDLGRLVGIISHVEELKERIPTQIVVENRGAEGSFLKIVKH